MAPWRVKLQGEYLILSHVTYVCLIAAARRTSLPASCPLGRNFKLHGESITLLLDYKDRSCTQ